MKGFVEVSTDKVNTAINNYNKLVFALEELEGGLQPEIEKQVSEWGWYDKWAWAKEVSTEGAARAWLYKYNCMFDSAFSTYAQQGLITSAQANLYSKVFYSKGQKSDLNALVKTSSVSVVNLGEDLCRFVNYFQKEIPIE